MSRYTCGSYANLGLVFQERGGPRSVSGEPTEDTTTLESLGAEVLLALCSSGSEISNVWRLTTWN